MQVRPQNRDLGMVMREVDEDLAIFLGIRRNDETERNDHVLVDEFDDSKSMCFLGFLFLFSLTFSSIRVTC